MRRGAVLRQVRTTGAPTSSTPAERSWANALSTVDCATPAVRSSSTVVANPSAAASSAVARTQWSVAIPTTSTVDTSWSRSQSARPVSPEWPWKPEYAASCSPLVTTAWIRSVTSSGWKSVPGVPTTQCGGQLSTKSGAVLRCAPGSMWKSWVAPTGSQRWLGEPSATEIPAATSAPRVTASEPPSQKSFCTSTMINARTGTASGRGNDGDGDRRVTGGELEALPRDRDQGAAQPLPALREGGQPVDGGTADDEVLLEQPVAALPVGYPLGDDDLLGGRTRWLVPAHRGLAPAHGGLVLAALDHRPPLHLDQLVDQLGGRRAGTADHGGTGAVAVHRFGGERRDGVLVEVAGDDDLRLGGAERVEQLPGLRGEHGQVAGVQPDRAQFRAGDRDRVADALADVVRVDEQRGLLAQRGDLRGERRALVVVQQREGVRGGTGGRDAVAPAGLQVGGVGEAGQVRRAGRGHGRFFVGTPGAHLDDRPAPGGGHHPGGRRGDRAVVVERREDERLQDHALGEGAGHGEDRRAGEEQLTFRVPADVAVELVAGPPLRGRLVDDVVPPEVVQFRLAEAEVLDQLDEPSGAGHDAVAPAGR